MSVPSEEEAELKSKELIFYEACLTAWLENRMELDKQILTLSTLAIGLLLSFGDKLGDSYFQIYLWVIANALFMLCLFMVLKVFSLNTEHIAALSRGDDLVVKEISQSLKDMDGFVAGCFLIGIVFSFLFVFLKVVCAI